jgi:DNA polymerase-3 subunit delta'
MSFSSFQGNRETVNKLRQMLASNRFPHAVIIAGPHGSGKYKLAQMIAKTMNCLEPIVTDGLPDYCGHCANCVRIAQSNDLDSRFAEAVEAREGLRDADKKDTRVFVQSHPDVLAIPPDPPQLLIKLGQVRRVIETIYFKPAESKRRVYIFTSSAFMKEAANSLLKILEEPPDFATIFLLTQNAGELLPTIRSRCITFTLAALPVNELETILAKNRPQWTLRQRQLVARLSNGAVGRALSFDLDVYTAARKDALLMLQSSALTKDHTELFRTTDTYRAGAEGKDKTDQLIRSIYSLLEDLLLIKSGTPTLARNTDILSELERVAGNVTFDFIVLASERLGRVESGMRRNLLRSLSLDAFATSLEL